MEKEDSLKEEGKKQKRERDIYVAHYTLYSIVYYTLSLLFFVFFNLKYMNKCMCAITVLKYYLVHLI